MIDALVLQKKVNHFVFFPFFAFLGPFFCGQEQIGGRIVLSIGSRFFFESDLKKIEREKKINRKEAIRSIIIDELLFLFSKDTTPGMPPLSYIDALKKEFFSSQTFEGAVTKEDFQAFKVFLKKEWCKEALKRDILSFLTLTPDEVKTFYQRSNKDLRLRKEYQTLYFLALEAKKKEILWEWAQKKGRYIVNIYDSD